MNLEQYQVSTVPWYCFKRFFSACARVVIVFKMCFLQLLRCEYKFSMIFFYESGSAFYLARSKQKKTTKISLLCSCWIRVNVWTYAANVDDFIDQKNVYLLFKLPQINEMRWQNRLFNLFSFLCVPFFMIWLWRDWLSICVCDRRFANGARFSIKKRDSHTKTPQK